MRHSDRATDNVFDALSDDDRRMLLASLFADSPPTTTADRAWSNWVAGRTAVG